MEKYSTSVQGFATGTTLTAILAYDAAATPTRRLSIYDILLSSVATPADQAARFAVIRATAIGTGGSARTPNNLDPGGPAGECTSKTNFTANEPTYTANSELLVLSINQRATFRWVAAPGSELRATATQNNGLGLRSINSTSTQAMEATVLFEE